MFFFHKTTDHIISSLKIIEKRFFQRPVFLHENYLKDAFYIRKLHLISQNHD